ncbi:MAG: hypothetical protein WC120_04885 [Parcubacteria group bacterium]
MFEAPTMGAERAAEKGENVKINLMFIRHGERTKKGELTDYGRQETMERAEISPLTQEEFDAVKSMGSPAGPKSTVEGSEIETMSRATETAHIFGSKIAELTGSEEFETRNRPALSFETVKNKMPYNHTAIYNSLLPENFETLSDEEKAVAAAKAQASTVNHLMNLDTPEAIAYKQEVAGAYSYTISHYAEMAERLKAGSKVLMPTGVHSPMMEVFLQKALVRKDAEGNAITGFTDVAEIGGEFGPSEGYSVNIETDENGQLKPLGISFSNEARPKGEMYLDPEAIKELADAYKELHKDEKIYQENPEVQA